MDELDDLTVAVLNAANIDEALLHTLSRDDLRDLLPGPENFLRRKQVWALISLEDENPTLPAKGGETTSHSTRGASPISPHTSTTLVKKSPKKTLQLPSPPEYVVYTDSELEQARKHYVEMVQAGKEGECVMSKELRCRLVRNTVTSMISILRASQQGEEVRYPSKHELTAMARRLVEYYPMLQDKGNTVKHMTIYNNLHKRLQNIKSPQKRQGPTPERGQTKKRRSIDFSTIDQEEYDADSSGGSTIILHQTGSSSDDGHCSPDKDSPIVQARHYKTLQDMYKKPKPNQDAVSQILDLEFQSRRAFIDGALKEEDRPTKILDAYPCFKDLHHVMGELQRILANGNHKFIEEVKKRWEDFCTKVQFYAVWKKAMKPPMTLDATESVIALYRALPTLFPSPAAPPKKLGHASEALLHVLQPTEDPAIFLQKRSLSSPVLLFDGSCCVVAIGTPYTTFPKENLSEGLLYLMAYYYTMHLTYPKCVATLLSVIQTEILQDAIHERDATASYKRAMAEWMDFIGK
ncbi:hypothetical protein JOB18_013551 [Solea senegalensis]|nr:hypothetical protein JOB18_013551 [Solea senegalensis]KAG7456400.1 hypothetical protein JOB18_013551 [Solea senegalensis]